MIMPPGIRRVPPQEGDEEAFRPPSKGKYIATFLIDDDADHVRYVIHLPLQDGDPTLSQIEDQARELLRTRLLELAEQV